MYILVSTFYLFIISFILSFIQQQLCAWLGVRSEDCAVFLIREVVVVITLWETCWIGACAKCDGAKKERTTDSNAGFPEGAVVVWE